MIKFFLIVRVLKLADRHASGACVRKNVRVRLSLGALIWVFLEYLFEIEYYVFQYETLEDNNGSF